MPGRYARRRADGSRDRAVALPFDPVTNDELAEAAEQYVAGLYGLETNPTSKVDDWDILLVGDKRTFKVDVKWTPHDSGRLVVFVDARVKADIYVLVTGTTPAAFRVAGWAWGFNVRQHYGDVGWGKRHVMTQEQLMPNLDMLMAGFRIARL